MSPALRSRLLIAAISVFLAGGLALLAMLNMSKPRVVVVHSLSKESAWADAVDRGIRSALSVNRTPISVTFDYLNLDLLTEGADLNTLGKSAHRRIEALDPQIVIVVDDEANHIVGRKLRDRTDLSLIFTGLIEEPATYGYVGSANVSGVKESLPVQPLHRLLQEVWGGRSLRLAVLSADNLTGRAELRQALGHDWSPHRVVASASVPHAQAWKDFVLGPAQDADVLVVLSMDTVAQGAGTSGVVPERELVMWTEANARPPVIGMRQSYVRLGGGLAVASPPSEFGYIAMRLALQRLEGSASAWPGMQLSPHSFDISMRSSVLDKRAIRLPDIYREAARGAGLLYP